DLIYPRCEMDLDMSISNGDMVITMFVHLDTAASARTLDESIADFCFKLIGGIFIDVKINISLEQLNLQGVLCFHGYRTARIQRHINTGRYRSDQLFFRFCFIKPDTG